MTYEEGQLNSVGLDDIPGVSGNRKKALLTKFGSVERIKKLPAATLAEVRRISPRLDEEIAQYLTATSRRKCGWCREGC